MSNIEEAIERCKSIVRVNKDFLKGNKQTINQKEIDCIETVLNMLKEKDREIEKLKADNKKAWKLNANMSQRHLSDIFKIKKKDKIIDLMVRAMDKIQDPQVCKYCDNKINLNHAYCVDAGKCKEGIKQYFKEIAERKK